MAKRKPVVIPDGALTIRGGEFYFDEEAAAHAVQFFEEYLRHSKGEFAGELFVLTPWQKELVREMFGWKRASDGSRRYRTVYVEIPRKNGKSTIAAGIGLYLLTGDGEMGAEVYSAAGDKDQAAIVFKEAAEMVRQCPELSELCEAQTKSIVVPTTVSGYRVLSSEAFTKHGLNASGIIFDELHAQPNRELWDVLTTSVGARRQPLTFVITTAGFDKNSICYEQHLYAEKVRDGVIDDPTFLPLIFAADVKDDWKDPEVWKKANPNLGISLSFDYLAGECKKAQESPAYENTFKRLHLNIWTEQETRWMPVAAWDASDGELMSEDDLAGRGCFVGLDLSSTTDITAALAVFPRTDGTYDLIPRFWVPQENARIRSRRDRVPYVTWIEQGLITATPGNVIDYDYVKRDLVVWLERFECFAVAYDPWAATQISLQLQQEGLTVVPFRQGYASLSGPTKTFGALVGRKMIRHGANPVLRWMFSNVAVESDPAGNIKPSKKKAVERIDGIVAAIMAVGRATLSPDSTGTVYSSRGMMTI